MIPQRKIFLSIPLHLSIRRELVKGIRLFFRTNPGWEIVGGDWSPVCPGSPDADPPDGVIAYISSKERVEEALRPPCSGVNVSSALMDKRIPQVVPDNAAIGAMAAEFLFNKGYRRFMVAGEEVKKAISSISQERFAGFEHQLKDWNENVECRLVIFWNKKAVPTLEPPWAIYAINDTIAHESLNHLYQAGLQVPEDVVILGTDNESVLCETALTSLSSIDVNAEKVGFIAAEAVFRLIDGRRDWAFPIKIQPARVVERSSTDRFTADDENVALAKRFIASHALSNSFQIQDIVDALKVSRRTLERKFKAETGYTLHDEIRNVRVGYARELLEGTNLPVEEICLRCGMLDRRRFADLFKTCTGKSPSGYRLARRY